LRAVRVSPKPSSPRVSATANPMPLEAPVTMAARPGIRDLSSTEFNPMGCDRESRVAIDDSPVGGGRTAAVLRAMAGDGGPVRRRDGIGAVLDAVEQLDALVVGSD